MIIIRHRKQIFTKWDLFLPFQQMTITFDVKSLKMTAFLSSLFFKFSIMFAFLHLPSRWLKATAAGCLLSLALAESTFGQGLPIPSALDVRPSTLSPDESVSLGQGAPDVLHTGAAVSHFTWWDLSDHGSLPQGAGERTGTTNHQDVLEGFCWDDVKRSGQGQVVSSDSYFRWRYRRQAPNDCSTALPDGADVRIMSTITPGQVTKINGPAFDPDIAMVDVGWWSMEQALEFRVSPPAGPTRPLIQIPVCDSRPLKTHRDGRGYGIFYFAVGYQTDPDSTVSEARLAVYRLNDPISSYADCGTVMLVADVPLQCNGQTKGHHVNVAATQNSEIAVTWESQGSIMGQVFYFERPTSPTAPMSTNRPTPIAADLKSQPSFVVISKNDHAWYFHPDVAAVNVSNPDRSGGYNGKIVFTYIRQNVIPATNQQLMMSWTSDLVTPLIAPVSPAPTLTQRELYPLAMASSTIQLRLPRIDVRNKNLTNEQCDYPPYNIVFEEHRKTVEECDVRGGVFNLISSVGGELTMPTVHVNTYSSIPAMHINQCLAIVDNSEPVVGSDYIGSDAVCMWTCKGTYETKDDGPVLDGTDILGHSLLAWGDPMGRFSLNSQYASAGTHYRVNNNMQGNQRAPSVAMHPGTPRVVTMWYDEDAHDVIAHDNGQDPKMPDYFRQVTNGTGAGMPVKTNEVSRSATIIPNPTGFGGVLNMELAPEERVVRLLITEINSGKVVTDATGSALPSALKEGQNLRIPLKKLVPSSLRRGVYAVKVITSASTYTSRLLFDPSEK